MEEMHPIKVAALYRFVSFDAPEELQPRILAQCLAGGIKGTILLAHEGINGTVAGEPAAIDALIAFLRDIPGCAELDVKYSHAKEMPFYRMKVRLKKEIVTLGVEGIDPKREVGTYVQPEEWNALISDPDTVLIDTRNDYEVAIGTFEGAVDPRTKSFTEFPEWFREHRAELAEGKTKFAMFCTGGDTLREINGFPESRGDRSGLPS